jgi:hypothetical protein
VIVNGNDQVLFMLCNLLHIEVTRNRCKLQNRHRDRETQKGGRSAPLETKMKQSTMGWEVTN